MKLSISNIAWGKEFDEQVYSLMGKYGFSGLEIAPTRIFDNSPYDRLTEAKEWAKSINNNYSLCISSMQSIWYGKTENIFSSQIERDLLSNYTKKAIDFAVAIECKNLVFGCPKNRNKPENVKTEHVIPFFAQIGEYACSKGVSVNIEANPVIYNTNFINTTQQAFDFVREINSRGINVNLDFGTMIENAETIDLLENNLSIIKHIHISEPFLKQIKCRKIHLELAEIIKSSDYNGFISIEMGRCDKLNMVEACMKYLTEVFV